MATKSDNAPLLISNLTSQQVAALSAQQIASLTSVQLSTVDHSGHVLIADLSPKQVTDLSAQQVTSLTTTQLLTTDAGGHLVVADLSPKQIASLTAAQLSSADPLGNLLVTDLSSTQVADLTAAQLTAVGGNGHNVIDDLNVSQLEDLTAAQFKALSPTSLSVASGSISYNNVLQVLQQIGTQIGSGGLSSSQITQLQSLAKAVALVDGSSSYIASVLHSMVFGDSGGEGALAHGVSSGVYEARLNQWLLGTDNPTPVNGDSLAADDGPLFLSGSDSDMGAVVSQGYYNGDCWLVSAIAATADVNPALIHSMIQENSNGTYAVQLYNTNTDTAGWVTVDDELPTYTGVTDSDGTIWGGLIEKAYVEAQADGIATPDYSNAQNTYNDVQGGWGEGLSAITGMNISDLWVQNMASQTFMAGGSDYTEISQAFAKDETVLFASNSDTSYGLVADHMFEVLGVSASNGGSYTLMNPWGPQNGCVPFQVSANQLQSLSGLGDCFLVGDQPGPGAALAAYLK